MSDIPQIVRLDSRVYGYNGEPVRLLGAVHTPTGRLTIQQEGKLVVRGTNEESKPDLVIVTDSMASVSHWDMCFQEARDLKQVIAFYREQSRAGLIRIADAVSRHDPKLVLQLRKVDDRGGQWEIDTGSLQNGHIAALVMVWAGVRACMGNAISDDAEVVLDDDDCGVPWAL